MITGVRLTQLSEGEPLLGTSWNYKNLYGVNAVEKRLEDLFYYAKYLGFNYIIDAIKPQLNVDGNLHFNNNGLYGNIWTFERRMELYQQYSNETGIKVLLEVDFPTNITSDNLQKYADYFTDQLIPQYNWVTNWQIMTAPETLDQFSNYKCSPENYVEFMKIIYPKVKAYNSGIKIGGPDVFNALAGFYYNNDDYPEQWLSIALGEKFGQNSKYDSIGISGFIPYIDFFSIQGKQNTDALNYNVFPLIINKLNLAISSKSDRNIPIYSLVQGWQASFDDPTALKQQGYYELREILNCVKKNVIPFKYQLADEFFDPNSYNNIDPTKLNYGLLNYYLDSNLEKPAAKEYYFLIKNLVNFNQVTNDNKVIENNSNVDSLTLLNDAQDTSVTIIWPKNFSSEEIVLMPHYARKYLLPNGTEQTIINPTQITFKDYHFILIFEKIEKVLFNVEDLESKISKTLNYTERTLAHLINLLPPKYNKEIRDVNYYKLLRSLAVELADAKFEIEELKDNIYLDSAHGESIYNNFGVLVNLQKKDEWDYDKYRRLVKGVTKSLLNGPTPQSIVEAIQLFTNFDISILELYKANNKIDPSILQNVNPQFAFVVEIEKPIGESADPDQIYSDVNYVLNIIKPAHTIQLIVIVLTGKENYREQYLQKHKMEFSDSDKFVRDMENKINEGIFGWKNTNYPGQFKTANVDVISNNPITNGGLFIGPRYALYDNSSLMVDSINNETLNEEFKETINSLLYLPTDIDNYKGANEESSSDFNNFLKEQKFGLDYSNLIQLSNNLTTLNNYKLSVGSKLYDHESYDFIDFLEEKDIGPDDSPVQYITLNSTPLNYSKFIDINKKVTEYFIELDMPEEDFKTVDSFFEGVLDIPFSEYYRSRQLGPAEYHTHKKLVKIIEPEFDSNKITLPESDLFTMGYNDIESPTKVYVNGIIMPHWTYHELPSIFDQTRGAGIEFIEDIITPGDIVNILYLKDRSLIIGNFPIIEDNYVNIVFFNNEISSWRNNSIFMHNRFALNMSTLNDSPILGFNQEVFSMGTTLFDKIDVDKFEEKIHKKIDYVIEDDYKILKENSISEYESNHNNEISNWRYNSIITPNRFALNMSILNNSPFVSYNQEVLIIESDLSDKIEINKIQEKTHKNFNSTKEEHYKISDESVTFEGNLNKDVDHWRNNSILTSNRFALNTGILNNSPIMSYNQEINVMEFTLFDEVPSPIDSLTM